MVTPNIFLSFHVSITVNPLLNPPLKYSPPLSNKPTLIRGGKSVKSGKSVSPPPPPPPFFTNNQRGLISDGLFRLEIHIVFGLLPHDLQPHVLNFFNFTL